LVRRKPDYIARPNFLNRAVQRCAHPSPEVTINVWPNGCACQAVRAPGSNVTLAPATRAGSDAWNNGSIRTVPVNQSAGPLFDGCEPLLLISIMIPFLCFWTRLVEG